MAPQRPVESTTALLDRVRGGDGQARERLVSRFLPVLRRWAHGRLPVPARGAVDTDDLVQVTLLRALDRLHTFEPQGEGAFLAFLRRILLNQIRDELRRSRPREDVSEQIPDLLPSPVEDAIGRQVIERYEEALLTLEERQREAIILRIEFDYSHEEVAAAVGCPTANAARMLVSRALLRLAEILEGRV